MALFECDRCGKCCTSIGSLITIERQLNDRDYYCRSAIDNTLFLARVEPPYREEIADAFMERDPETPGREKGPCRFLRKDPCGAGTVCAIHASRPAICREFRCYRMVIRTRGGTICGRVIGKNTLRTEDAVLENLWKEHLAGVPYGDCAAWIRTVTEILAEHGYCADPVE